MRFVRIEERAYSILRVRLEKMLRLNLSLGRAMPVSLCLDFGTAYSKASAWTTDTNMPIPLQVGCAVGHSGFTIPTTVAVTSTGLLYFGEAANEQGKDGRTLVFGDLKSHLTRRHRSLDGIRVPSKFNPSRYRLTIRDVISLYMGFLTHAATKSLPKETDVVRRTLTMPVFSGAQDRHMRHEMGISADFGWVVRDMIEDDDWESGLDLRTAIELLSEFQIRQPKACPAVLELAEPLAAFAVRMATYDPTQEPRRLSMVIDVGAGTVDFGMFASIPRGDRVGVHPIANAKHSLPVGGNDIDAALVNYVLDRARLGNRRRNVVEAIVSEQARELKERLFNGDDHDEVPVADAGIYVTKGEFLDSSHWKSTVSQVNDEFRNRFEAVDVSWLNFASTLPLPNDKVDVFLSGGGARLPFLREMIRPAAPQTFNGSKLFYVKVALDDPSWATNAGHAEAWGSIEEHYPQLAVSLGGAVFAAGVNKSLSMHEELIEW